MAAEQEVRITLHPQEAVPAGMIYVPATQVTSTQPSVMLPAFWMDRLEVTNGEFKKFMDAGGYQKPEYWEERFVKGGKTLSWSEAMAEFRDATGRTGPATWQLGTFAEGTDQFPVSGVSWYEAAAYAAFAGKSLPSVHEWNVASGIGFNSNILQLSNFNGKAPARGGEFRGMGPFGTFDTAGNVKEWTINPAPSGERYILGGGWNEPAYAFSAIDARTPFARDETFGFRLVKRGAALPGARLVSWLSLHRNRHPRPLGTRRIVCLRRFTATISSRSTAGSTHRRLVTGPGAGRPCRSPPRTPTIACSPTCSCRRTPGRHIRSSPSWAAPRSWMP